MSTCSNHFNDIPVVKKYLNLPYEEKFCSVCNTPWVKIGEEFVRRELSFAPAKLKVTEIYSLYAISIRQTKSLLTTSFRFHLTMDTLAVQLYPSSLPRRVRDFHPL
ncbi:IS66 family transposase zinc-finger binding domain-containing protein [Dorea formicigenerans]|uniref:IS66 family transposase zinc-finger binding domain-containing protein n=1 Tax=Dorea formicigenerans TaxID=39486 RepID=UPI0032C105D9